MFNTLHIIAVFNVYILTKCFNMLDIATSIGYIFTSHLSTARLHLHFYSMHSFLNETYWKYINKRSKQQRLFIINTNLLIHCIVCMFADKWTCECECMCGSSLIPKKWYYQTNKKVLRATIENCHLRSYDVMRD